LKSGKNILEIGCGNGLQLEFYKKYGLETKGLEPYGPKLTEEEKDLGIQRKSVIKAHFPKKSFDYIVMKEVLEHIPNPKEVLKKCHSWLKDEGKLIIIVPNRDGLWRKIFSKNWYGYDIPRHVYAYNPKSISVLLEEIGFEINNIRKYDVPYMIDGSLKFYLVDNGFGRKHNIIFSGLSKLILTPLSLITTYLNLGSIIDVEAKKMRSEKKIGLLCANCGKSANRGSIKHPYCKKCFKEIWNNDFIKYNNWLNETH
jgi:SAM-dependent methyltransferase